MTMFTSEHIMAEVHANPYADHGLFHVEAQYATVEEIEQLQSWLTQQLDNLKQKGENDVRS